jgi:hypothetical protein
MDKNAGEKFGEDNRLKSMFGRDICPYSRGTHAHRLSSKNEIQSLNTTKESKKNPSPSGEGH